MSAPLVSGRFRKISPHILLDKPCVEPIPRSGHACATDECNLYVFGGYNPRDGPLLSGQGAASLFIPARQVMSELWIFNFAARVWTKLNTSNTPDAAASCSLKLLSNKILVYGGTVFPFGHLMSNCLYICDLSSDEITWQQVTYVGGDSSQMPPQAYGQSVLIYESFLYVFGGAVSFYLEPVADLHRLNLKTKVWEQMSSVGDVPRGRYKQEIVYDEENNRFLVLGGGHLSGAEGLDKIHCYNFDNLKWSIELTIPDKEHNFPQARSCFGCAQYGNFAIVSGGRHYRTLEVINKGLDDVWHLHIPSLHWTKLDMKLPKPLYFHTSSINPLGELYIFGGIVDGDTRTSDIYKMQITFPKLNEITWNFILDMLPFSSKVNLEALIECGIPASFVKRLDINYNKKCC